MEWFIRGNTDSHEKCPLENISVVYTFIYPRFQVVCFNKLDRYPIGYQSSIGIARNKNVICDNHRGGLYEVMIEVTNLQFHLKACLTYLMLM